MAVVSSAPIPNTATGGYRLERNGQWCGQLVDWMQTMIIYLYPASNPLSNVENAEEDSWEQPSREAMECHNIRQWGRKYNGSQLFCGDLCQVIHIETKSIVNVMGVQRVHLQAILSPNHFPFGGLTFCQKGRKGTLVAYAMKRVAAGAHLPTHWVFEPAKRTDDKADYFRRPNFRRIISHELVFAWMWFCVVYAKSPLFTLQINWKKLSVLHLVPTKHNSKLDIDPGRWIPCGCV